MDEKDTLSPQQQADRRDLVERRLEKLLGPPAKPLDQAEIDASRNFHIEHWLKMAERAIQRDHSKLYYSGLSPNLEATVAQHEGNELPPELAATIRNDLAFMQGHIEAFRFINEVLAKARKYKP
jgi:hypothetical protein